MTAIEMADYVFACPECFAENEIIGSVLPPGTHITCSVCGAELRPQLTSDGGIFSSPLRTTEPRAYRTDCKMPE